MCTDELKRFSCFQIMTDLKVIGAGLGRTGTKSLQQALVLLGFGPCHHMTELLPDNQEHLWPMWKEIFSSSEDKSEKLKEAFRGYVATTDYPGCLFYKEFLRWNPNAKVILTVRDNPEKWVESVRATLFRFKFDDNSARHEFRESFYGFLTKVYGADPREQETDVRKLYLDWNEELKRSIKKENLLVFNVKEGWGPLCKFLGVPEPKQPFPNLNSKEFYQKKYAEVLVAKKD